MCFTMEVKLVVRPLGPESRAHGDTGLGGSYPLQAATISSVTTRKKVLE